MNRLIQLTRIDADGRGHSLVVNARHIVSIEPTSQNQALVTLSNDVRMRTVESFLEITNAMTVPT